MRKRADDVTETRQRIVEAAVRLHGTLGPVATTVSALAEEAAVTRLTVYRHFPDDRTLFAACSAHWASQQTLPDAEAWARILGAEERLRTGLADLYRFYREGEPMLSRVQHDLASLPEEIQDQERASGAHHRDLLLQPFRVRGARRRRLRAMLGHAVAFETWRSLSLDQGLTDRDAVEVMVRAVTSLAE